VLNDIACAKREYKEGLVVLKKVKKEVGAIQDLIRRNTSAIKNQFKTWHSEVLSRDGIEPTELAATSTDAQSGRSKHKDKVDADDKTRAASAPSRRAESKTSNSDDLFFAARQELLARKQGK